MAIEVKEIIVRTTINEDRKSPALDHSIYKKIKQELLAELKKELKRYDKRKKER